MPNLPNPSAKNDEGDSHRKSLRHPEMIEGQEAFDRFRTAVKATLTVPKSAFPPFLERRDLMLTFIEAIAREEGFPILGSRAERNNNPGNLNFEPWLAAEPYCAVLETPLGSEEARFCRFPDGATGYAALRALLTRDYLGETLHGALNRYAPPSDGNDTSAYESAVCAWTGMQPSDVLTADNIG